MINPKESITSKQLMVFIIATQVGFGILMLPSTLAEKVGHDGWITILLSGIVFTLLVVGLVLLLNRFKSNSIIEINRAVYGGYIGTIINLIYMIYCYSSAAATLRVFIETIKINILRQTPDWAIILLIIMPAMYICWYGLKLICRFDSFIFIIIIFTLVVSMFGVGDMRLDYLLPMNEVGLLNSIKATIVTINSLMGAELILFIYPYIKDKEKTLRYIVYANVFTALFYIIVVVILTAFFGEYHLSYLLFAIFRLAASYRVPIFERMDMFLIILWIFAMYAVMLAYYFCAYNSFQRIFKLNKSLVPMILFFIISILLSRIPKDFTEVMLYEDIVGYAGVGVITLSLITYILSIFRKRSGNKNDA